MCNTPRHQQVVADPQPKYHGPVYPGVTTLDVGIAPLMQKLWELGFETQASCQGWSLGSEEIKAWGPHPNAGEGYILFRDVHKAIDFFRYTFKFAANRGAIAPHLTLETAHGLTDDRVLTEANPRGTIRFKNADLNQLEGLWLS